MKFSLLGLSRGDDPPARWTLSEDVRRLYFSTMAEIDGTS